MVTLESYACGQWRGGGGKPRVLRHAVTGEPIAEVSSEGLDFGAMLRFGRERGGPALRKMTFPERAALKMGGSRKRRRRLGCGSCERPDPGRGAGESRPGGARSGATLDRRPGDEPRGHSPDLRGRRKRRRHLQIDGGSVGGRPPGNRAVLRRAVTLHRDRLDRKSTR